MNLSAAAVAAHIARFPRQLARVTAGEEQEKFKTIESDLKKCFFLALLTLLI